MGDRGAFKDNMGAWGSRTPEVINTPLEQATADNWEASDIWVL